jgi:hypothetical protein
MYKPLINAEILAAEITVDSYDSKLFEIIIPFAQSENGETIVSLKCEAKLVDLEDRCFYEFSFHLLVVPDPANRDEVLELWSPATAANYIPEETRKLLLPTICECYKALVQNINKMPIYRVTYGTGDVPKRNQSLTNILENAGYEVEETGTDDFGRTFWMMVPKV